MSRATDDIGDRGEALFKLLITEPGLNRDEPYFRPRFLGEKNRTYDFLVELVGKNEYLFFVQVKSTRRGYREGSSGRQLKVTVNRDDVRRMIASPIPAYVVGIDEPQKVGYLLSMNEPRRTGLSGLPTRHHLDCANLPRLWDEIEKFWTIRKKVLADSYFV